MSFTAEIKDELSRIEGSRPCEKSQLAALSRVCGTLSLSGQRQFALSLSTETGAVARSIIRQFRGVYGLACSLTVRKSVLHKTRNYLISLSTADQPALGDALVDMGILSRLGSLEREIVPSLVRTDEEAAAYLRGAFMGGGFVAEPHTECHFELVAQTAPFAEGLCALLARFGVNARVNRRRGSFVIYLKNADEVVAFLTLVGAPASVRAVEQARAVKSVRNVTNRIVNAELANQRKVTVAAAGQTELVDAVDAEIGIGRLPPALRDFCELRREHPELSLRELGEEADPPLSKSAVAHRVRRLEGLLAEAREKDGRRGVESRRP